MLTIFIVIVVPYHLSPSDDNDINATYIRKLVQKYCDVTFICDLQCYLFYEIYVPSMEVLLQVCNKDQDMEVWIAALFFSYEAGTNCAHQQRTGGILLSQEHRPFGWSVHFQK